MAAGKLLFYLCANQPDLPRFSDNFRSILHVLTRPVRLINTRQKNNLLAAIFAVGQWQEERKTTSKANEIPNKATDESQVGVAFNPRKHWKRRQN